MSKRTGFTLIELLVVIAIIALLLSIIMPSLQKVKQAGRSLVCRSNVRQMTFGMIQYAEANEGKAVPMSEVWGEYWFHQIAPYLGAEHYKDDPGSGGMDVAFCPSTKRLNENPAPNDVWGGLARQSWRYLGGEGSYGMNLWLQSGNMTYGATNYPENQIENMGVAPGRTPVFADSFWVGSWPFEEYTPPADFLGAGPFSDDPRYYMGRFLVDRHGMAVNVGCVDGSAEKIDLEDMWTLRWHRNFATTGDVDLSEPRN